MQDRTHPNRHFGDSYSPACRRRSSSRTVPADRRHRNSKLSYVAAKPGSIGCSRARNHMPTRPTRSSSCRTASRSRMCRSIRWAAGPSSDDIPGPIYNSRPTSSACFTPPSKRRTAGSISGRSILNAGRFSIEKRSRRACRFRYGMGPWSTSRAINCVSALPILRPPQGRRSSRPRNWRKFPPMSMSSPLPARC